MLNLNLPGNAGYFIDRTTVPADQIVSGSNTVNFFNAASSLFAAKIYAGNFCVPIMWYIYNSTNLLFSQVQYQNPSGDWNSFADIISNKWTILYPLDKVKSNHTHIGIIDDCLSLVFTAPSVPTSGGLTIYTCFTAVPDIPTI